MTEFVGWVIVASFGVAGYLVGSADSPWTGILVFAAMVALVTSKLDWE